MSGMRSLLRLAPERSTCRALPRISGLAYFERWLPHWPRHVEDSSPLGYASLPAAQAPDLVCSLGGEWTYSKEQATYHLAEIGDFLASGDIHSHFHPATDHIPVHCHAEHIAHLSKRKRLSL